jgi:ankyrin repeat protein
MGNAKVAKLLIEKGADINATDESLNTPAMNAEKEGHHELAAMLGGTGKSKERKDLKP